jgi:hypothetical protein
MNTYRHTQRGTLIVVWMIVMSVFFAGLAFLGHRALLGAVPIMLVCGWLFHSLTIEIDDRELRWRFGPGWIHKSIPLNEIASARAVRTNFIEGWGIHLSRFGWLYNVSGRDAVAITLKDGKRFALGTDDAPSLLAHLNAAQQ